jgi:hypothetical protein
MCDGEMKLTCNVDRFINSTLDTPMWSRMFTIMCIIAPRVPSLKTPFSPAIFKTIDYLILWVFDDTLSDTEVLQHSRGREDCNVMKPSWFADRIQSDTVWTTTCFRSFLELLWGNCLWIVQYIPGGKIFGYNFVIWPIC